MALFSQRLVVLLLMTAVSPANAAGPSGGDEEFLVTDFAGGGVDPAWYVVNDDVMGGRSTGDFELTQGVLVFSGVTNTDGGGFSSIRTKPLQLDLSERTGIRLQIKGDGRRYSWRLTTDARWRGRQVGYWADFATLDDTWTTVDIPFSRFMPQFRGQRVNVAPLDAGQITSMGVMIYDQQDGPFHLEFDSVHAYGAKPSFSLEQFQWKRRVLVIGAPTEDNEDLEAQRNAVAASAREFADRDMTLVVLLESGLSSAGERELTAGESDAARTALGIERGSFSVLLIGKDGSVKLSSDTATPMAEIYALIDTMPMRRREQAEDSG
jgi:NADH dehydrogenase [ubiquinone] 1 alpha subcomplex assembly factor 1